MGITLRNYNVPSLFDMLIEYNWLLSPILSIILFAILRYFVFIDSKYKIPISIFSLGIFPVLYTFLVFILNYNLELFFILLVILLYHPHVIILGFISLFYVTSYIFNVGLLREKTNNQNEINIGLITIQLFGSLWYLYVSSHDIN